MTDSVTARFIGSYTTGAPSECWLWKRRRDPCGYGKFHSGGHEYGAHRVMWMFVYGFIPAGLCVLHRCDTPSCVNPMHLFLGTPKDNSDDKHAKGRANMPTGKRHGRQTHPERTARGERCGGARLADAEVVELRRRAAAGENRRALSRVFGISWAHVYKLINGTSRRVTEVIHAKDRDE